MKCWVIEDTEDHISSEAIDASSAKMMRAGAVLVVVRGMILVRSWPIAIAGVDLTINQDMKALRPRNGIRTEYLAYILRSLEPQILDRIETAAHGTKRLRTDTLEALRIPSSSPFGFRRTPVRLCVLVVQPTSWLLRPFGLSHGHARNGDGWRAKARRPSLYSGGECSRPGRGRPCETPHVMLDIPCLATYTRAHAPGGGCGISDMCTDRRSTGGKTP
jgi:hypothetical protein